MEASKSQTYRLWLNFKASTYSEAQAIYKFLDKYQATECGDGMSATFNYPWPNPHSLSELPNRILEEIQSFGSVSNSNLYLVFPRDVSYPENEGTPFFRMAGKFILGGRNVPLWSGYYNSQDMKTVDE